MYTNANDDDNNNIAENQKDVQVLAVVDELIEERKIFDAAKLLLSSSSNNVCLSKKKKYRDIVDGAELAKRVMEVHLSPPESTVSKEDEETEEGMIGEGRQRQQQHDDECWKKQGESHGNHDFIIYYKYVDKKLMLRIESPIEESLLIPLISVLNETELYHTFMPRYTFPARFGLERTKKLQEKGIGCQLLHVIFNMPFPVQDRDFVQETFTVDDIDDNGTIIVLANTVVDVDVDERRNNDNDDDSNDDNNDDDVVIIPPVGKNVVRMEATAGVTIRKCPSNHPALLNDNNNNNDDPSSTCSSRTNNLILITITSQADPKLAFIPQSFINFATRTAIGGVWASQLQVAESIRDGNRPLHQKAINSNRDMYDWIEKRIEAIKEFHDVKKDTRKEELTKQPK